MRLVPDSVEAEMIRALGIAVVAVALAGCGGGDKTDAGRLSWAGKPSVFKARNLPNDRVVIARVKNTGRKTLHLVGARLVVRDADGKALRTSAAFNTTFAHGLYGALQQPAGGPPVAELIRLGKAIYLPAGGSAPFYAAWRLKPGTKEPVRIDYGTGSLAVPNATATAR
jgi:hypothetical protein